MLNTTQLHLHHHQHQHQHHHHSSAMKLVDVFFAPPLNLDSTHTQMPPPPPTPLKKCQIPLLVDDCPTIVLQFDQQQLFSPPGARNHAHATACNLCSSASSPSLPVSHRKDYELFFNKYVKCCSNSGKHQDEKDEDECEPSSELDDSSAATVTACRVCYAKASPLKADTVCTCNVKNGSPRNERKVASSPSPSSSSSSSSLSSSSSPPCSPVPLKRPRIVATQCNLMHTLSKLVSCIGCRTSVERFYKQLVVANNSRQVNLLHLDKNMQRKSQSYAGGKGRMSYAGGGGGSASALDPFLIRSNGDLTIKKSVLMDPQLIYKLFYLNW